MDARLLSIVIPSLNEAKLLPKTVINVQNLFPNAELIVADGGSYDNTVAIASELGAITVQTPAGRGTQCYFGARAASRKFVLFLHADTRLSTQAANSVLQSISDDQFRIGQFELRFSDQHWLYRLYAYLARVDSVFTSFGDQGILIRRDFYYEIGAMAQWPLFEDVDLLMRARAITRIEQLEGEIITSARRFRRLGLVRAQLMNACYLMLFLFGVSPHKLARSYYRSQHRDQHRHDNTVSPAA